ncbi:MAG: aspartate carbamoyltransferase catalytic subunit [Phycisphaerales bacterium]|nr:aspartate carbamoyltransferase catalytic subunit [Phycisphaerales bacterium]
MWNGHHLLGCRGADAAQARELLSLAHADAFGGTELNGRTVANLFFEDSTRTRVSFTIAAQNLGARVVDLGSKGSSLSKGESLIDTAWTIESMGVDALVVRAAQSGACELISRHVGIPVINAGDGMHQHPTQALTDALNIGRAHGRTGGWDFSGLHVVIVGDVVSSRVARSNAGLLRALGARVTLCGPAMMCPGSLSELGCEVSHDLDALVDQADVMMMLRIQFERGGGARLASSRLYHACYGLTLGRAARMKDGAIVMHPGPMNRGVEIAGEVADGSRSVIRDQVEGGVLVRKAALKLALDRG